MFDKQIKQGFQDFVEYMWVWFEVFECYLCFGDIDYLFKVCVFNLDVYQCFLVDVFVVIFGVWNIDSIIVVKQEKYMMSLLFDEG